MPMNLDKLQQKKTECTANLLAAFKEQDETKIDAAIEGFSQYLGETIGADAEMCNNRAIDTTVLASRGVRMLTQAETQFYDKFITAAKSADPKQAIANVTETMPITIIDAVLEGIRKSHRLLELVELRNSSLFTKYVYNKTGKPSLVWGEVTSAITNELSGELGVIEATLYKLSALMYIPKDILDLGATWVDRFVREMLAEYLSLGLEDAIVDGDGKDKYIGMTRDVSSTAAVVGGVYPRKTAVKLDKLTAKLIGSVLAIIAKDETGQARKVESPIFVVNPFDYFLRVMPATTVRGADGTYRNDVLPYPLEIVQSAVLSEGLAVIGIPSRYLALVGLGKDGKIEYDDSYKFAEDMRTYIAKMFGTGRPLDNNAFVLCDISELEPADLEVIVKSVVDDGKVYTETELEAMTKDKILVICKERGYEIDASDTKADIITAFLAAQE